MIELKDVKSFCDRITGVTSPEILLEVTTDICDRLGFVYFALVQHVDIQLDGSAPFHLYNYPEEWVDQFRAKRLLTTDPIHRASYRTATGFAWHELEKLITLTPADRLVLDAAARAGLQQGFTTPTHVPGEISGTCSFAMAADRDMELDQLPVVQLISTFVLEAARRVTAKARPVERAQITDRQVQCVTLVAKGKTDWEISRILGISHETVTQHVKDARERYGVTRRAHLATRALFEGHISFADIFRS